MIAMMGEQIPMSFPDSWSGRMSPEHSAATTEKTSLPSWRKLCGLQNQPFLYLDMRGGDGLMPELLSDPDGVWLGERMMPAGGERRSEDDVLLWSPISMEYLPRRSCLSAILEENPDPKYTLSAKACLGILRRAVRRGKIAKMPEILVHALEKQSGVSLSEIISTDELLEKSPSASTQPKVESDSPCSLKESKVYGFPLGFRPENVNVYEETSTTLCNGTRPGFTTGIVKVDNNDV